MVPQAEMDAAPKIVLAKQEWAVPELAARQLKRLLPAMLRAQQIKFDEITEEDMALLFDLGFIALSRAYPNMTRDEFDDLPIRLPEIMAAMPVIAKQAGMEVAVVNVGEAQAEMPPT